MNITRSAERGVTLITAMVFLLIFALITATAMRSTMSSSQAIGNMQFRSEAISAANDAIVQVLAEPNFTTNMAAVTAKVNATPIQVDANGDGTADVEVSFPAVTIAGVTKAGPRCLRYRELRSANLNEADNSDQGCFGSSRIEDSGLNIETQVAACAQVEWVVPMRATDTVTSTSVTVYQGTAGRVSATEVENECK